MTDAASAPSKHSEQCRYYRDRATAIRAHLPTLQDDEVFTELYLLADHYERLAEFAESSGSLGGGPCYRHRVRCGSSSRRPAHAARTLLRPDRMRKRLTPFLLNLPSDRDRGFCDLHDRAGI